MSELFEIPAGAQAANAAALRPNYVDAFDHIETDLTFGEVDAEGAEGEQVTRTVVLDTYAGSVRASFILGLEVQMMFVSLDAAIGTDTSEIPIEPSYLDSTERRVWAVNAMMFGGDEEARVSPLFPSRDTALARANEMSATIFGVNP